MGTLLSYPLEYRMLIGSLQYLLFTRPYFIFAVNKLSQFMHKPTTEYWIAAKRILCYLAGTRSLDLCLAAYNSLILHAFPDADSAGFKDDYTSTYVYLVYVGKHLVSWSSKK